MYCPYNILLGTFEILSPSAGRVRHFKLYVTETSLISKDQSAHTYLKQ